MEAAGFLKAAYIDRGQFSGEWADISANLNDGEWHVMDFSSVVPANAKAVVIRLRADNNNAGEKIEMHKYGITPHVGHCVFSAQVAGITNRSFIVMGVDTAGRIEYRGFGGVWTGAAISLRGWIL